MKGNSLLGFACLLLAAAGCGNPEPPKSQELKNGGLAPASSPKEQLDEQRLSDAVKGLDTSGPTIKVATATRDRAAAVRLAATAERRMLAENVWFESVGRYRDALMKDPTYAAAYEGLARALLMEDHEALAEKALRTALGYDPSFHKARFMLGMVRQMRSDYKGAVAEWKALVDRDPAYPDAYARMAIASYYAQDFASAWRYLSEAERRKQNVPPQFKPLLKEVAPQP